MEDSDGQRRLCHPRGKQGGCVVGDRVWWLPSGDTGTIERVEPRRNSLFRQDETRTKVFAANIDAVWITLAAQPEISLLQLSRVLIAAEAQDLPCVIVLNKRDLQEPFARAWDALAPYREMGYEVLPLSTLHGNEDDRQALCQKLQGQSTLVLGPSGAGKSTLVNLLVPQARAATAALSQSVQTGRHTTTCTALYWIDAERTTALLDSPGFQEFGLRHIDASQLAGYMPDLHRHAIHCRFLDCKHLREPGCAVLAAVDRGEHPVHGARYRIYEQLYEEIVSMRRFR
ncbi:ribosome biogenesis GTPase [Candidatus Symbiobacter mobilis CR]|uniref:Small ribosomal subunit biogenesis GTPase RsgA n=1 Tax=Candidatus Symbiobacter mobilis CR TaxID=946483 RepID=U5N8R0_9BURK|nr:ribosome biogenesis GTPase [Candidatus Symbiobacter mobilis CR]